VIFSTNCLTSFSKIWHTFTHFTMESFFFEPSNPFKQKSLAIRWLFCINERIIVEPWNTNHSFCSCFRWLYLELWSSSFSIHFYWSYYFTLIMSRSREWFKFLGLKLIASSCCVHDARKFLVFFRTVQSIQRVRSTKKKASLSFLIHIWNMNIFVHFKKL